MELNKARKTDDFIKVIDKVLSPDLCREIIDIFDKSANVQLGRTGGGVDKSKKNSLDVSIQSFAEFSPILQHVVDATSRQLVKYFEEYLFALIGPISISLKHPKTGQPTPLTSDNFADLGSEKTAELVRYFFRLGEINAQKYELNEGGYPYWHSEIYPQVNNTDALHRNLLFMFYLNDVEQGGETEFYYQDVKISPRTGRMVIAPAGFTHTHRGNVPISNNKYILTSWVLFNPANLIYPKA